MGDDTNTGDGLLKDTYSKGKRMAGFVGVLKGRKKQIDEAAGETTEQPAIPKKKEEVPEPQPVAPAKRKVFSDGTEREWDDHSQSWVPLNPTGFKKAKEK